MKHFHLGATSGVLAATTTGVVFAYRNSSSTSIKYLQRAKFKLGVITVPTNAQEVALAMNLQSVFTANYSGGTDLLTNVRATMLDLQRTTSAQQTPSTDLLANNLMIATTTNLTAGGGDVVDGQPFVRRGLWHPAAAAQVTTIPDLILEWVNPTMGLEHNDPWQGCIAFRQDTGFNVSLPVALGAAYTARLTVELDWLE